MPKFHLTPEIYFALCRRKTACPFQKQALEKKNPVKNLRSISLDFNIHQQAKPGRIQKQTNVQIQTGLDFHPRQD